MAWWQCAFELSTASAVSGQLHQHLVWTRGKEWLCLLGMSEGPDNYIWQSHEEWFCNVIAKKYPFNSIFWMSELFKWSDTSFPLWDSLLLGCFQPALLFFLALALIPLHIFCLPPSWPCSSSPSFCTHNSSPPPPF